MVISELYNMLKPMSFDVDEEILKEFKLICIENDVKYRDMLTLAMKFIIRRNSDTDDLIYYLTVE